jgi:hypothetical protein
MKVNAFLARLRGVASTPTAVETTDIVNQLCAELERLAAEQHRDIEADEIIAAWCPRCHARRKAKALAMRRWRAKRRGYRRVTTQRL